MVFTSSSQTDRPFAVTRQSGRERKLMEARFPTSVAAVGRSWKKR